MSFNVADLNSIELHLRSNTYLSTTDKPTSIDALTFTQLKAAKIIPNVKSHPSLFAWYSFVCLFTPDAQKTW